MLSDFLANEGFDLMASVLKSRDEFREEFPEEERGTVILLTFDPELHSKDDTFRMCIAVGYILPCFVIACSTGFHRAHHRVVHCVFRRGVFLVRPWRKLCVCWFRVTEQSSVMLSICSQHL